MPDLAVQNAAADPTDGTYRPRVTVFHCSNALMDTDVIGDCGCEVHAVNLPCSSMTREVFLLKAFEAGADAVIVLVCPPGECDYVEGNTRAAKRVEHTKRVLDEIGIGGERLNIYHIPRGDTSAARRVVAENVSNLKVHYSWLECTNDCR